MRQPMGSVSSPTAAEKEMQRRSYCLLLLRVYCRTRKRPVYCQQAGKRPVFYCLARKLPLRRPPGGRLSRWRGSAGGARS